MDLLPGQGGCRQAGKFFGLLRNDILVELDYVTRWEFPDENGETRKEYNERFGREVKQEIELDPENTYFFELFYTVSNAIRTHNGLSGSPEPFEPNKIMAWAEYTGHILSEFEKKLLLDMDRVFRKAWHEENAQVQERIKNKGKANRKYE